MAEERTTTTPDSVKPTGPENVSATPDNAADATGEVERLRQLLAETEQKLVAVETELNNFKLRLADMENYRKRLLRNVEEEKKYALEPLARDLLGAFDNLERAIEAARSAGDNGPLAVGVGATAAQMLDIFRRHGVTRIECAPGDPFDPTIHQAVAQEPTSQVPAGHIVRILHHGFRLHDRILRPTAVVVAVAPEPSPCESEKPVADASATPASP
ncbi:MAG: nucleotide exchange factor GrpE [Gemmataceae bacterium]|nr:nucleotide exchange factor GrpE [Gemmataceae bacterium]MCS7271991.1 nucleotide exchange factor GrpE [Gemmataceae bacterium]MDW8241614.1 nucleotide exchange factor GrpE [Thermogemmata sp.]